MYVAPVEYDEIRKALKSDRIVFIIGTKEYGKTYTAIRLFEYYKKGYEPKYVRSNEGQEEKGMVGKKMSELMEMELKPKI